jgi:hypothetical protein
MKKQILILSVIFLLTMVLAQDYKMQIIFNQKTFKAGEDILFRINIYDLSNNIISEEIQIIIEDVEKINKIEKIVNTKDLIYVDLGEKAKQGQWKITAKYKDTQTTEFFFIEANEKLDFSIEEDLLIIKNSGNIRIDKNIQIIIGETKGDEKKLILKVNEETKYRLIAPEGNYDIKVISDEEVLFSSKNIALKSKGVLEM